MAGHTRGSRHVESWEAGHAFRKFVTPLVGKPLPQSRSPLRKLSMVIARLELDGWSDSV